MPLILLHSDKMKKALAAPASVGIEVFVLAGVAALFAGLILIGEQVSAPLSATGTTLDPSLWQLPKYTAFTLLRGLAAYVLSLLFTMVYGSIAGHSRRAEKIMIPALDILQSLPVLIFLPGLQILFGRLFPTRQLGLELACVITIFTAQAWNMCFSFFGSVRGIPATLREVTAIQRLNSWQVFRLLEVPASMIGLVWNSMMSMAGGWFFIAISEDFGDHKLPGLGSYMNVAQNPATGSTSAQIGAVVAMVIMIVALDQLVWRPIVAWSERFKLEDVSAAEAPKSWVMDLLHRSRLIRWVEKLLLGWRTRKSRRRVPASPVTSQRAADLGGLIVRVFKWATLGALAAGMLWGLWAIFVLLRRVPLVDHLNHNDWRSILLGLLATFARVATAVTIGAAWTLPAGILIGLNPRWAQRLQPVVQVVASFPATMLFPWVVIGLRVIHVPFTIGCISLLLLGTQWYVLFNVIAGAMAIPSDLREAARVYRLGRWFTWRKLYIPAVFPYLVTGLVTAAGGAWNATIVAEYFNLSDPPTEAFGLGSIISKASLGDKNASMLAAGGITMAVFVVLFNRVLWKKLYRIAEQRYSLNL